MWKKTDVLGVEENSHPAVNLKADAERVLLQGKTPKKWPPFRKESLLTCEQKDHLLIYQTLWNAVLTIFKELEKHVFFCCGSSQRGDSELLLYRRRKLCIRVFTVYAVNFGRFAQGIVQAMVYLAWNTSKAKVSIYNLLSKTSMNIIPSNIGENQPSRSQQNWKKKYSLKT